MIIYQATKAEFVRHALDDDIERVIERQFRSVVGHRVARSEVRSWQSSLLEMARVMRDPGIPDDVGVGIEYQLPQTSKRIDFLITGTDGKDASSVIIVELKQWSSSRRSAADALIWARRGGRRGESEGVHPSYQAWSYAAWLEDFNAAVGEGGIGLRPCAYLHNHPRDGEIDHPHYAEHLQRAPLFLADERGRLQAFIRDHVRHGDSRQTLYAIENGRIRPSKGLADAVSGLLAGRAEFTLIDDQKVVFEAILSADARSVNGNKQVVIVKGGPGTGKSVVAINLLAALLGKARNARYVSKNAAPRAVYAARLAKTLRKTRINNLFCGSGSFTNSERDTFDTLIVDEAHRLNRHSGLYGNLGEDQVRELINAARCVAFFVDDDQLVHFKDIGTSDELRRQAVALGADLTELTLASQFRCSGSDGYLAWLDNALGIRATANVTLDTGDYDFRVVDDPNLLHAMIERCNTANGRSRVVAGYCWPWPSRRDPQAFDVDIAGTGYRRRWNLDKDGSLWIIAPGSIEQVGCIHTCQGLELDYVGVIIGPDLVYRDGRVAIDAGKRAASDQSVKGLKAMQREDPARARMLAERIVRNTYRTLMTRGMKGCYIYCTDPALRDYWRGLLVSGRQSPANVVPLPLQPTLSRQSDLVPGRDGAARAASPQADASPPGPAAAAAASHVVPLRSVTAAERLQGVAALPVIDLRFAAGAFSDVQALEDGASSWVAPPDWVSVSPGLFVAQVVGESMNRRIPNGAWCVFRAAPAGSRQGKVVVVQHRRIDDPETGGQYTIKRYSSEKVRDGDDAWRHERITLHPDSDQPGFEPIVLDVGDDDEAFTVVAEMLVVLDHE